MLSKPILLNSIFILNYSLLYGNGKEPVKFRKVETGGSKIAFFGEDEEVYIYKMEK